jgi:Holliday junction resolvase RusA-like endonuclease
MLSFTLKLKPISLNACFVQIKGRRVSSKNYVNFKKQFDILIAPHALEIKKYFESFNELTDEIHSSMTYYTPDLYTKRNTINQKSLDVDNIHKPISDLTFKIIEKADDSAITTLVLRKFYSHEYAVSMTYQIVRRT